MFHVILIALVVTMALAFWNLIHASPRSIAMLLPEPVAFVIGTVFLCLGLFLAFVAAYEVQHGPAMLGFFLKGFVGLWFLLAHRKGDEVIVRRAFLMMGVLILNILAIYYLQTPVACALVTLALVTGGYWLTMNHEPVFDRVEELLRRFSAIR